MAGSDTEEGWNPSLAADRDSTKVVGYDGTFAVDSDAEDVDVFDEDWERSLENEVFCEKMVSMSSKSLK